jgi:hypothetical protein
MMRKLLIAVLAVGLVLSATPASGVKPAEPEKAQTIDWFEVGRGQSNDLLLDKPIDGHANLNTPNGAVTMVINGQIVLDPDTTYVVWIREFSEYLGDYVNIYPPLAYCALGYFTTNTEGVGSFHFNIADQDLAPDTRNIQLAVNTLPSVGLPNGWTVAATVKYTLVVNH